MTAHSPGPWRAEAAYHSSPIDLLNPEPDYWYIDGPGADVHGSMPAADAYLIAAAPDLLRKLSDAANYIDTLGGDSKPYRTAIAKATQEWSST